MKKRIMTGLMLGFIINTHAGMIDDFTEGVTTNLVSTGSTVQILDQTPTNIMNNELFDFPRRVAVADGSFTSRPSGSNRMAFSTSVNFGNAELTYGSLITGGIGLNQNINGADTLRINFASGFEPSNSNCYLSVTWRSGLAAQSNIEDATYSLYITKESTHVDIALSNLAANNSNLDFSDINGMNYQFAQFNDLNQSFSIDSIEVIPEPSAACLLLVSSSFIFAIRRIFIL